MCRAKITRDIFDTPSSKGDEWREWLEEKQENRKLGYQVSKAIREHVERVESENRELRDRHVRRVVADDARKEDPRRHVVARRLRDRGDLRDRAACDRRERHADARAVIVVRKVDLPREEVREADSAGAADAKRIGLVDILGGLDKAIEIAAKKAKLKDYRTVELPKLEDPFTSFISGFSAKVRSNIVDAELGNERIIYHNIQKMLSMQGILARMPYDINFY